MKFTAAGDFLIQQPFDVTYDGFETVRSFISRGDVRFFNLETTLNTAGSSPAAQHSGGSYLRAEPGVLEIARSFGFNMTTFNNNHAFDFEAGGFLSTLESIEASGFVNAGCGRSLPLAAAPAYLTTPAGRAALISVSTSFAPSDVAGDPSECFPGRPGVNGLRTKREILVTAGQMRCIQQIADDTGVNAVYDNDRKDGYLPELEDGVFELAKLTFRQSDTPGKRTVINGADLKRTTDSITRAKKEADFVIVSLHNHEIDDVIENVPEHLVKFCRSCIDAGASAVICHGPHVMRAVEIYKGRPIFHSLGDFVLQLNSIPFAPAEFYQKHGVEVDAGVKELLRVRSNDGKRGLMYNRPAMETFVPYFEMERGELTRLELLPVELGFDDREEMRGIPRPAADPSFMERLARLSAPFGTVMHREGDKYIVDIKKGTEK